MTRRRRLLLAFLLAAPDLAAVAATGLGSSQPEAALAAGGAVWAIWAWMRLYDGTRSPRLATVAAGRLLGCVPALGLLPLDARAAGSLVAIAIAGALWRPILFRLAARVRTPLRRPSSPRAAHELALALRAAPQAGLVLTDDDGAPPPAWPVDRRWTRVTWPVDRGARLLRAPETPGRGCSLRVKRALDLVLVLPLLVVLAPLLLIVALVLRWRQGPPVIYRQVRWTRDRRPFAILKFRSMATDAEAEGRPTWPRRQDDRSTGLGGILRRLWLDELPQLANVLRGELSLVGPRPERPEFATWFLERLPIYRKRYETTAGVTGLAQVEGYAGNTSMRKRAACDALYVRRWSPLLDLRILLATLLRFVRRPQRPTFDFEPGGEAPIP